MQSSEDRGVSSTAPSHENTHFVIKTQKLSVFLLVVYPSHIRGNAAWLSHAPGSSLDSDLRR